VNEIIEKIDQTNPEWMVKMIDSEMSQGWRHLVLF